MRIATAACATLAATALLLAGGAAASAAPRVLRVGTYHGIRGQYRSIQAAVNAARAGDWILIAPGDYKTSSSKAPKEAKTTPAGVLITTPGLHLRGMNRDTVVVDGTKPGSAECSQQKADQNFGPKPAQASNRVGLNGIMVYKADKVSVQNLTTCNFLNGPGAGNGNEIWWNGGADSGKIGGWGFNGSYLTATTTYYQGKKTGAQGEKTAATYGIFSGNWSGGTWNHTYTSNFNDSGLYIGACKQVCDQTVNHAWSEFNALGYSGSNSGGWLVVKNSQFDNNEDGFDTNSQNGDEPSPQNGACPKGVKSPIHMPGRCWVFMHNYVHDNNNPNVPSAGNAAAGPVGTGVSVSGGRNDTIIDNLFANNGAWGTIFVPFPDSGPPCKGGTGGQPGTLCLFDEWGDALLNNHFKHNGFFGNPTNGDFGAGNLQPNEPTDCFHGNREVGGGAVTSSPPKAQKTYPKCNGKKVAADLNLPFIEEVACDAQVPFPPGATSPPCLPTDKYPRRTKIVMHPLPKKLKTMPNPCAGVPKNPWCK